ncbi:MAG: crotonase/enoyl-CoA hydratase family protein [Pseudomonadota bacterium]
MPETVDIEIDGSILKIGLNRIEKRNIINQTMMRELSTALTMLCEDTTLRCAVLYSKGDQFCAGLDLVDLGPTLMNQGNQQNVIDDDQVDLWNWGSASGRQGRRRTKPVVTAINGKCFTAGIELALATDTVIAEQSSTFSQAEVTRGLIPLGGAIERYLERTSWGNAMQLLLTGEEFHADLAKERGLVQEVVPDGTAFARAMEIAETISKNAPLAITGVLENGYIALGESDASEQLRPYAVSHIAQSDDLKEGLTSFFEKRAPIYVGK